MVGPRLLILLLNLLCLASVRSVVAQNGGGPVAAGLLACSDDATCAAFYYGAKVHCAPDGYCGDAGAACSGPGSCYGFCGQDGICGGVGAQCNTNDPNDYAGYKCFESNTCTGTFTKDITLTGICEPSGPSGSSAAAAGLTACSSDATCVTAFQAGVYCAPDGYCGDTGAACSADVDCWGTFVKDSPQRGVCASLGPTGSQRKRRSDLPPSWGVPDDAHCARLSETACRENGRSVCTDLKSDFMNCGACGNDCGEIEGAAVIGCIRGQCVVVLKVNRIGERTRKLVV
ncbi:hypothetical protein CALVIDRAFT_556975 [Calocera viscosa TUFC12733]|uniref:Carbohydrate-binding module family 18 protein n=1 Tax=Calocera viscosa (strain TUFC12733) TaxID=1330018 RepID=A0A167JFF4_CALVF|nr:hypothetical protein CALVIDRAFT_556975 [Calocera viscosa TUFC12733]